MLGGGCGGEAPRGCGGLPPSEAPRVISKLVESNSLLMKTNTGLVNLLHKLESENTELKQKIEALEKQVEAGKVLIQNSQDFLYAQKFTLPEETPIVYKLMGWKW